MAGTGAGHHFIQYESQQGRRQHCRWSFRRPVDDHRAIRAHPADWNQLAADCVYSEPKDLAGAALQALTLSGLTRFYPISDHAGAELRQ